MDTGCNDTSGVLLQKYPFKCVFSTDNTIDVQCLNMSNWSQYLKHFELNYNRWSCNCKKCQLRN